MSQVEIITKPRFFIFRRNQSKTAEITRLRQENERLSEKLKKTQERLGLQTTVNTLSEELTKNTQQNPDLHAVPYDPLSADPQSLQATAHELTQTQDALNLASQQNYALMQELAIKEPFYQAAVAMYQATPHMIKRRVGRGREFDMDVIQRRHTTAHGGNFLAHKALFYAGSGVWSTQTPRDDFKMMYGVEPEFETMSLTLIEMLNLRCTRLEQSSMSLDFTARRSNSDARFIACFWQVIGIYNQAMAKAMEKGSILLEDIAAFEADTRVRSRLGQLRRIVNGPPQGNAVNFTESNADNGNTTPEGSTVNTHEGSGEGVNFPGGNTMLGSN